MHWPDWALVLDAMAADPDWCASALCRSEALLALHRLAGTPSQAERLWSQLRDDWDAFVVIPVDDRCLALAAWALPTGCGRSTPSTWRAAARLPCRPPPAHATFDRRQIPAAAALGFEVVAPLER